MVSPTILTVIHQYLQEIKKRGVRISQAILFGSYARGMATADSDIDLLIIGPDFDPRPSRELVGELWRARAVTDSRIEPVAVGTTCWEKEEGGVLIDVARREGIPITPL